jgi:hypothetical protein
MFYNYLSQEQNESLEKKLIIIVNLSKTLNDVLGVYLEKLFGIILLPSDSAIILRRRNVG